MGNDHEIEICDFCNEEDPIWIYPCGSFIVATPNDHEDWGSAGDWAACKECHELIEDEKWKELAVRAASKSEVTPNLSMGATTVMMQFLHAGFRANRTGEPYRNHSVNN